MTDKKFGSFVKVFIRARNWILPILSLMYRVNTLKTSQHFNIIFPFSVGHGCGLLMFSD
jgi:hypothetical protein